MLMTAMFSHGFIISNLKFSTIKPIPKNKYNLSESSNYRSIAISSVLGKLIDRILLDRLSEYLISSDMQFGFKPAHSTSMCTFVLKETLSYYTQNDSSVYCVLLDASKAFDRISYTKLFNCLIDRNLPAIVIRFLINLYTDQSMCVKWIASRSSSFAVYNGVKQGAISSPILFCIYIDNLLLRLKSANIGCFIGNIYTGCLAYADDLTLLSLTADAMRRMLDICSEYAKDFSLSFNASKSKCLLFHPKRYRIETDSLQPTFQVDGKNIEYVNSWPHLGHMLDIHQSDSECILLRHKQLIGQINDVLCTFGMLDPVIKTELLYTYCSSLYGSVLWNLQHPDIDRICTAWRSALKRVWRLPHNAHSNIVTALSSKLPLYDELCRRVVNFHFACLNSDNNIIRRLCRYLVSSDSAQSPHGCNIRHISEKFSLPFRCFSEPNSCRHARSLIVENCYEQYTHVDVDQFSVLYELLMIRNQVADIYPSPGFFNDVEVNEMICFLCTN